jgi:hypothetical protein
MRNSLAEDVSERRMLILMKVCLCQALYYYLYAANSIKDVFIQKPKLS